MGTGLQPRQPRNHGSIQSGSKRFFTVPNWLHWPQDPSTRGFFSGSEAVGA